MRPISNNDAHFVVELRTNSEVNRYLHSTSSCVVEQLKWFAEYYERPGDYYFIVERMDNGVSEGVVAIYDIDSDEGHGEWGRWILRPGSLAAVESAWLIYRAAFELIGLNSVFCRTVENNAKVVSFHDSCGISERVSLLQHFEINGQDLDAIEHRVDRICWSRISPKMEKLARIMAGRIVRG